MEHLGLEHHYGVVRFRGTLQHNSQQELVFQSDDATEAMDELERLCAIDDADHGYMVVVKASELNSQA